jgi:hypothetical protein
VLFAFDDLDVALQAEPHELVKIFV